MKFVILSLALLAASCASVKACDGYVPVDPAVSVAFAPAYAQTVVAAPFFAAAPVYAQSYSAVAVETPIVVRQRAFVSVRRGARVRVRVR